MTSFNPFSLEGKTILVTGASSGIGRGIAVTCSKMGATVIINGRNKDRLQETLSQMEGEGHLVAIGDLTDSESLIKMVCSLPKLDGLVQCAGMGQRKPCKDLYLDDVNQVMDVNFKAPVMLQAVLLRQKKINKGASIVFVASIASWSPSFGNSVYSASKGAIISYANCLALELAEEQLKEDEQKYPLKRYGQPDDIANLAVYMLSDASTWMTGSNVKISGGGKLS